MHFAVKKKKQNKTNALSGVGFGDCSKIHYNQQSS